MSLPLYFINPLGIDKYANDQGMLNASAIKKKQYDLEYPLSSAVRLKDNIVYGYCTCAPFICKYNLSNQVNSRKLFYFVMVKYQLRKLIYEVNIW